MYPFKGHHWHSLLFTTRKLCAMGYARPGWFRLNRLEAAVKDGEVRPASILNILEPLLPACMCCNFVPASVTWWMFIFELNPFLAPSKSDDRIALAQILAYLAGRSLPWEGNLWEVVPWKLASRLPPTPMSMRPVKNWPKSSFRMLKLVVTTYPTYFRH